MNNPFASCFSPTAVHEILAPSEEAPHSDSPHQFDPRFGDFGPPPQRHLFLKYTGLAVIIFLAVIYAVFREVQHNRDLYRMGRMVSAAEYQSRVSQEQQRLEEASEADLTAKLLRLQSAAPQSENAPVVSRAKHLIHSR